MMAGKSEIYFLTSFEDFAAEGRWNSIQARSALPLTPLKAASEVNSACQSTDLCVSQEVDLITEQNILATFLSVDFLFE